MWEAACSLPLLHPGPWLPQLVITAVSSQSPAPPPQGAALIVDSWRFWGGTREKGQDSCDSAALHRGFLEHICPVPFLCMLHIGAQVLLAQVCLAREQGSSPAAQKVISLCCARYSLLPSCLSLRPMLC